MDEVRTEPLETPRTAPGGFAESAQAGPFGGGRSPAGEPEAEERAELAGEEPKNESEPPAETETGEEPETETETETGAENGGEAEPPAETDDGAETDKGGDAGDGS